MNPKTVIPLAVALVLGLIAALSARSLMSRPAAPVANTSNLKPVVVAARNVPAGQALRLDDLIVAKATPELAGDAFADPSALTGRVTIMKVLKGQPLFENQLASLGTGSGMQALLPAGMRAITLEVNEYTGVAGFLTPGCHVDVVATVRGDDTEMVSRTVVQDIRVQAVGARMPDGSDMPAVDQIKSVTLVGSPREIEAIDLASSTGRVRLVLRGGRDTMVQNVEGVSVADLRGRSAAPPIVGMPATQPAIAMDQRPDQRLRTVEIIRGTALSTVQMPDVPDPALSHNSEEEVPK